MSLNLTLCPICQLHGTIDNLSKPYSKHLLITRRDTMTYIDALERHSVISNDRAKELRKEAESSRALFENESDLNSNGLGRDWRDVVIENHPPHDLPSIEGHNLRTYASGRRYQIALAQ